MGLYGSAPAADPAIGQAANKQAEIGEQYLAYMKDQSAITNEWAAEDRARYQNTFQPAEDQYVADAQNWDSPERKAAAASAAVADVRQQASIADATQRRQAAALGVNPNSGRYRAESARTATATALASAGAENLARKSVEAEAEAKTANAINLGKGLAVNPATSMGLSTGAASSGFQGAQSGYAGQASSLNADYQNRLQSWNSNQQMLMELGSGLGMMAGAYSSAKDLKERRRKVAGMLDAIKSMPVEKWNYKAGEGDGGEHVGPYAEDFQKATGLGNGREIGIVDAIGVTMGAVKELASKVDEMTAPKGKAA